MSVGALDYILVRKPQSYLKLLAPNQVLFFLTSSWLFNNMFLILIPFHELLLLDSLKHHGFLDNGITDTSYMLTITHGSIRIINNDGQRLHRSTDGGISILISK